MTSIQIATGAFMVLPLLAILILNLISKNKGKAAALWIALAVTVIQMLNAVNCSLVLWQNNKETIDFSVFWDMNVSTFASRFSIDYFTVTVLFIIGMVSMISVLVAKGTINEKSLNYTNLLMVIIMGMNGLVLVTDLFSLYVFLEITGIASFVLIALFKSREGLEGAFKYLLMSAVATVFLLTSIAFIFMEAGSLLYKDIATYLLSLNADTTSVFMIIAFILLIAAVAVKSGMMPFHGWLPDAYQSAPAAVSVLLGGLVTKVAGVYAIIRLMNYVFIGIPSISFALGTLALISIVFGAVAAVTQNDFKRILAYSSISQIGYIVLGAACGNVLGFLGAVLHFFNHATFKTGLFVNAAALEKQVGDLDVRELGGLAKQMPVTGISSILSFLSAAGIPPLAGFWSKLFIIIAVWQAGYPIATFIAVIASLFTLAYFLRLQSKVFYGTPLDKFNEIKEATATIVFSEVFLSVITVLVGVLFPVILIIFRKYGIL